MPARTRDAKAALALLSEFKQADGKPGKKRETAADLVLAAMPWEL